MKSPFAAAVALVGALLVLLPTFGNAQTGVTTTTTVVTSFTTYCPSSTVVSFGTKTYTITTATTLTITDCPCTLTSTQTPTVSSGVVSYKNGTAATAKSSVSGTAATTSYASTGPASTSGPAISSYTGAAAEVVGSGMLAILGGAIAFAL